LGQPQGANFESAGWGFEIPQGAPETPPYEGCFYVFGQFKPHFRLLFEQDFNSGAAVLQPGTIYSEI
jgi:hypothetical protein